MKKKVGSALVVGAGISGIRAALDLAENGYGVKLIDRSPHLGGILSQLDYQFPTDRCGMCKMLPLVDRDASSQYCLRKGLFHENIEILLSTELSSVEGEPGNYRVRLRQKPSWVDPDLCVGCGVCVPVCPVEVPDAFNAALATLSNIKYPSDIFPTNRFYKKDVSIPEMVLTGPSEIKLPDKAGIGVEPDPLQLDRMKVNYSYISRNTSDK